MILKLELKLEVKFKVISTFVGHNVSDVGSSDSRQFSIKVLAFSQLSSKRYLKNNA